MAIRSRLQNNTPLLILLFLIIVPCAQAGEWEAPAWADTLINPVVFDSAAQVEARALYLKNCSVCHGETGHGDGMMARGMQPPPAPFADDPDLSSDPVGELYWKISTGRKPMPSWKKDLTEEQRWMLVSYVKSLAPAPAPVEPDTTKPVTP
jgi:mono/diheme cytochrome c family protein